MKQLRILSIFLAVLLMVSCNKSEDQASGTGDVMIVAKQSGGSTKYGISIYAYTYSAFSAVKVVNASDAAKTYDLKANQGFKTSFFYETPESEYTTTKPAGATYNFSADFENGVHQEFQNTLTEAVLPIPVFERCAYNDVDHQVEIKWTLINGASSYAINILDGTKVVFASVELKDITSGAYAKKTTGSGWAAGFVPKSGSTYTVRLFAYLYEPGGGSFNIQSISIADQPVVWGN
ncbi:MAG TPA: hypothetical protein VGK10_15720 [Prolixibacteraceae bacterium]